MSKLSGLGGRLYSGETSFNIVGNRRRWYTISAVFILLSIGALVIQGLHLGIEFKGGSSYTVNKAGTRRCVGLETITPMLRTQIRIRIHTGTVAKRPMGIKTILTTRAATIA